MPSGTSPPRGANTASQCPVRRSPRVRRASKESVSEMDNFLLSAPAQPPVPPPHSPALGPALPPCSPFYTVGGARESPRGERQSARSHKKEAIAASSTLDYVALSACDEEMVQERRVAGVKRARGADRPGGTSRSDSDGPSSEMGDFQLNTIQLPKRRGPGRPQSSRGGDVESRFGDFEASGESLPLEGSSSTIFVPPRVSILRAIHGTRDTAARPPSSLFDTGAPSRAGSACQRSLRGSLSSAASYASLSRLSAPSPASIFSASLMRSSTETPPGGADAFEGHQMLVRCPAPKRPARTSQPNQPAAARARALPAYAGRGIGAAAI